MSVQYNTIERTEFVKMCADWSLYCDIISRLTKLQVLKLMKYLVDERPNSRRLLVRAISRFNRLNALKKEDLI